MNKTEDIFLEGSSAFLSLRALRGLASRHPFFVYKVGKQAAAVRGCSLLIGIQDIANSPVFS